MNIRCAASREEALALIPELCRVWNAAMGPGWPLTPRLLSESLQEDTLFIPAGRFLVGSHVALHGWLFSKTNVQGGPDLGREVLADHGNMSAPTVLFVLDRARRRGLPQRSVLTALGPGFTASTVTLLAA